MTDRPRIPPSDRPHLSASSIEMMAKCGEAYRRRYVEGDKIPPNAAMVSGSAFHKAAEHNMRQKMDSHENRPLNELISMASDYIADAVDHGDIVLDKDHATPGQFKDRAIIATTPLVTLHYNHQAPDYQPVEVEAPFRIELPAISHDVVGVVDIVSVTGEVTDFKTAKRRKPVNDADVSVQLSMYAASRANATKQVVPVKLDVAVAPTARNGATRQVIESIRTPSDLPILGRRIEVVAKTVEAGLFVPAPTGSWWCSESWCGYWHTCPYINSERIAAAKQTREAIKRLEQSND